MLVDRTGYLSDEQNIKIMSMIKNTIEKEIQGVKAGCKKQYTPNQLNSLYEQLYNKLAYNIELFEQY